MHISHYDGEVVRVFRVIRAIRAVVVYLDPSQPYIGGRSHCLSS